MSERDVAALQRAQSIAGQPSFLMLFGVCLLVGGTGIFTLILTALVGVWGFVTFGAIAALVAVSVVTKQGDNIMMGVASVLALISGVTSIVVLATVMTGGAASASDRYRGGSAPTAPAGGGH